MPTFRAPRGLRDLLPPERQGLARLERLASELAARYGYRPIETPLFEQAGVFERGLGEVTDVIEKELFLLQPRDEDGERLIGTLLVGPRRDGRPHDAREVEDLADLAILVGSAARG